MGRFAVKSWLSSNRFKRQQKAPFRRRNVILTLHASFGTYMFYDMRFRILLSSASPIRECMKKNKEKLLQDHSVCCCIVWYSSFLILCKLEGFWGFFHHKFSSLCPNNLIWSKSREIFYYPPPPLEYSSCLKGALDLSVWPRLHQWFPPLSFCFILINFRRLRSWNCPVFHIKWNKG